MDTPILRLLRREWSLAKGNDRACCEVWTDGPYLEARLVKAGKILLRDQSRSDTELRHIERGWRDAMESQGWRRVTGVERLSGHRRVGRPVRYDRTA
jgi:hypothetical protein